MFTPRGTIAPAKTYHELPDTTEAPNDLLSNLPASAAIAANLFKTGNRLGEGSASTRPHDSFRIAFKVRRLPLVCCTYASKRTSPPTVAHLAPEVSEDLEKQLEHSIINQTSTGVQGAGRMRSTRNGDRQA
jgi:hypothetical protein